MRRSAYPASKARMQYCKCCVQKALFADRMDLTTSVSAGSHVSALGKVHVTDTCSPP